MIPDENKQGPGSSLRHYATKWKVEEYIPEEVIGFSSIFLILPLALGPWGNTSWRVNTTKIKNKAIHLTGRGGLWGCEMLRIPHSVDSRLTDGGKVVSLTHRQRFTPQEDSCYSYQLEDE
jgi:hypothetical protein